MFSAKAENSSRFVGEEAVWVCKAGGEPARLAAMALPPDHKACSARQGVLIFFNKIKLKDLNSPINSNSALSPSLAVLRKARQSKQLWLQRQRAVTKHTSASAPVAKTC